MAAKSQGVRWAVHVVDHARIDEINILQVGGDDEAMRLSYCIVCMMAPLKSQTAKTVLAITHHDPVIGRSKHV